MAQNAKALFKWAKKTPPDKDLFIKGELGTGQFSVVKRGAYRSTGKEVAIKQIFKSGSGIEEMVGEVEIMKKLDHPHILHLYDVYETNEDLFLIMELVNGGELFDRIVERGSYTEKDAADLLKTLAGVINHLHGHNLIHRDLKPENLLYSTPADDAIIKVADFGLARDCADNQVHKSVCGTPGYMSPEMVNKKGYGKPTDVYSLGVILYILLCGFPPFDDDDMFVYEFPSPEWDTISNEAKDMVNKLLELDPKKRLSAEEILHHPWLASAMDTDLMAALIELKKYNARRRFKKGIIAVRTTNFLKKLLGKKKEEQSIEEYFRGLDASLTESAASLTTLVERAPEMLSKLGSNDTEERHATIESLRHILKTAQSMEKELQSLQQTISKVGAMEL